MKFRPIHIVLAIFFLLTLTSTQCEREEPIQLPPETQTGANTFGCYINGELFVARFGSAPLKQRFLTARYTQCASTNDYVVDIQAHGKRGWGSLSVSNPEEGEISTLSRAFFFYDGVEYYVQNAGTIFFTRLDTVNRILSGTFAVDLFCSEGSILQIIEGRFDIRMREEDIKIIE